MITVKQLVDFLEGHDAGYEVAFEEFQNHIVIAVDDGSDGSLPSVCIVHGPDCPVYNENGMTNEIRANMIMNSLEINGFIADVWTKEVEAKILEGLNMP